LELRAILESARGIKPDDVSESAKAARQVAGWGDFDGLRFMGRIGVQPAQGQYGPKNILLEVITPGRKGWRRVEQQTNGAKPPHQSAATLAPAGEIVRPAWAR
jgi:hypothetical protein